MLRNVVATSSRRLWRFHSSAAHAGTPNLMSRRPAAIVAISASVFLWYISNNLVHNDAADALPCKRSSTHPKCINSKGVDEDGVLCAVVWGSNRSNLIDPQSPEIETFQTPVNARWLENIALRDMVLHERHGACVDARGDVYQWGDGFFGSKSGIKTPRITLRGKNIIKLQLTGSRVYALSASGKIYVFAANEEQQGLPTPRTSSKTLWGLCGWTGRGQQTVAFVEIFPKEKLNRGEVFVSMVAGTNHLLALTSEGRTYAHPINKDANSHGQLGLRNIETITPSGIPDAVDHSRIATELVPQSVAYPYTKTSLSLQTSPTVAGEHLDAIDGRYIEFCDALFEIPSLRGVKVSQIAAGSRSSFVNTSSGRVLGWGANEHGQIGLGSGITLDMISIPTEIDLTRNISVSTRSKCLSIFAGGDLTCFVAKRSTRESHTYVDILCCGNGQWGGLGNNTFSTFQGNAVRVKNVSGLHEFNEQEQKLSPIIPHAISVSPTGHILLSLDTQSHAGPRGSGRDLVVWGLNHDYQLGTGKRISLSAATTLERPEGGRFILAKRKATVRDLSGKLWKKNIEVEQCALAGYDNSVIYWKIKP